MSKPTIINSVEKTDIIYIGEQGPAGPQGPPGGGGEVTWVKQTITAAGSTTLDGTKNYIKADCTAGNQTIVLPDVTALYNREFIIERIAGGANLVTVQAASGQTIHGAATWELYEQRELLHLLGVDGTDWRIF